MSSYRPSPLATVDYEHTDDGWALVFVRDLKHPPTTVWAALTEPEQLARWAPFTAPRNLSEPGSTTLTMIDDAAPVDLPATVTRVEEPSLLEYTWGEDRLRWDLEPTDSGTRLTLRHRVQGPDWLAKVAAGWHMCLDVAEHLLDGDPIDPIRGSDAVNHGWNELHEAYEARFDLNP